MSTRNPLGVCGMITPWNFPMAIPSWKIIPALVCGNTAVLKPAEDTPLSAINFVRVLEEAGLPKGVVNLVLGSGEDAGTPLARHSDVAVISFTGSMLQTRTVPSREAVRSRSWSGKNSTRVSAPACPRRVASRWPVLTFQRWTR